MLLFSVNSSSEVGLFASETFLTKLDEWAYIHPERRMYTYLDEDLDEAETYTI